MKKIRIILSKEQFKEVQEVQREVGVESTETYEQYLAREKKRPTHCLFG